jgi:ribosome maturation factor RimP
MDLGWLDKLRTLAEGTARSFGCELFDLENRLSGRRWLLRVTLDRLDGPVTIADCEAVSRQLSAQLDVEDLVPHAFELEVSSPGVERPLRAAADYERFKGQLARIILGPGGEDAGQVLEGDLEGAEGDVVKIKIGDEVRSVSLDRVKVAHLLLKFP